MTPEPAETNRPAGSGVSASGRSASESDISTPGATSGPRVRRMFTTRRGGVSSQPFDSFNLGGAVGDEPSAVAANRAALAVAAGLPADGVVWMRQVHGTTVLPVAAASGSPPDGLAECDGIVTATPGVGLAVLVADCVPILAADQAAGVVAAVHAGRRGAAARIGPRAVEQMVTLGAAVERIEVLLGPAICGACYEVPAWMQDEVEAALPGSASRTVHGTTGLDLQAGLARQFRECGVGTVLTDSRCTYTDPELFSHRRQAPTGRFAGLIWLAW